MAEMKKEDNHKKNREEMGFFFSFYFNLWAQFARYLLETQNNETMGCVCGECDDCYLGNVLHVVVANIVKKNGLWGKKFVMYRKNWGSVFLFLFFFQSLRDLEFVRSAGSSSEKSCCRTSVGRTGVENCPGLPRTDTIPRCLFFF